MDVTCNVIEDLLPLYADGICSEDSKTIIEHHTAVCAECRAKLDAMTVSLEKNEEPPKPENPFKKTRSHYVRLIVITLCIAALIVVPSVICSVLTVNETYDTGYSWSTLKFENKLRDFGRMIKKGDYRKALDTIDFWNQGGYSDDELSDLKDLWAEDMESYFAKNPIIKIKAEGEKGKCENGALHIYVKTDAADKKIKTEQGFYFVYSSEDKDRLEYGGHFPLINDGMDDEMNVRTEENEDIYWALQSGFPEMLLAPRDYAKIYFDRLKDDKKIRNVTYNYYNKEMAALEGLERIKIVNEKNEKLIRLLESYEYIDCQYGDVTYMREDDGIISELGIGADRFYCQYAELIMQTKNGEEFTVSFDIPAILIGAPIFTSCFRNITYSDNTPEDFKVQFEEIFAR